MNTQITIMSRIAHKKPVTPKQAALLVYIKWSHVERTGICEYPTKSLCVNLSIFESDCPWCTLYHKGIRNCSGCPLDEMGQNCFAPGRWFRYGMYGDKVAAGNIARIAWQEYKRLGG